MERKLSWDDSLPEEESAAKQETWLPDKMNNIAMIVVLRIEYLGICII